MSTSVNTQAGQDNRLDVKINNDPPVNNSNQILQNQLLVEYQGDCIQEKRKNTFRIGLININGIPKTSNHPKNINIEEFLIYKFDSVAFVETNYFWPEAEEEDQWYSRVKNWKIKQSKSVAAYLKHPAVRTLNQPEEQFVW